MARDGVAAALGRAVAAERLRIVATLIRVTGEWDLAEDCLQDAVERALVTWSADGVPDNPAAWLTTAARRRAVDVLRRRGIERTKLRQVHAASELAATGDREGEDADWTGDDRLGLLFACCHPALPMAGRVALTLKTVTGLSTRELARAFLVSEATMGQRLLRTRNRIAHTGISLRMPEPERLADRIAGVLAVIYLLFNEGYTPTAGEIRRDDLGDEAVRLAGLVTDLLPADGEAYGLRALLLLQHARRTARINPAGELVTLEEQDRSLWDRRQVASGLASLAAARATGAPPGYYRLQAEIAAVHATAENAAATDWARIVPAYDALLTLRPSPIIGLNRAVAVAFRDGPDAGLSALSAVADGGAVDGYPLLAAVRADLQRRAGRHGEAAASYRAAIEAASTGPERRLLQRRLAEVSGSGGGAGQCPADGAQRGAGERSGDQPVGGRQGR